MLSFYPMSTIPQCLRQTIVTLLRKKLPNVDDLCVDFLDKEFTVSEPIEVNGPITKLWIKSLPESQFTGLTKFDYVRIDLNKYFDSIDLHFYFLPTDTVNDILIQIKKYYGLVLSRNDFNIVHFDKTVLLKANPKSFIFYGEVLIKFSNRLEPNLGVIASTEIKANAQAYSWQFNFEEFNNLAIILVGLVNDDLVSKILTIKTKEFWVHTKARADYNLYGAIVKYNGKSLIPARPETNVLVIELHPEYCEKIAGLLYLFY
jgi:hypothetical protein